MSIGGDTDIRIVRLQERVLQLAVAIDFHLLLRNCPSSLISNAMTRRTLVLFTMDICVSPLFCLLGYSQNRRPARSLSACSGGMFF